MKWLLLLFTSVAFGVFGQDTFTLEFKYGRSKITNDQLGEFSKFLKEYKKLEVDSIQFVGSSDSAGIFLSNFRMTELRSRKANKTAVRALGDNFRYTILPTQNKGAGDLRNIRAIDVVVYSHEKEKKLTFDESVENSSPCYRVAYSALQSCQLRYESRGSKGYVYLERYFPLSATEEEQLYFGTINDAGEFEAKPLKWKLEKTGSQHWKGERFVAKITEKDFDKFKIFTLENGPCTACHEDFATNKQIADNQPKNLPDYVLMEELQYRQPWLMKRYVNVRIPKEYVDESLDYVSSRTAVEWEEKAKNPDYYYAKVAQSDGKVDLIYRPFRVPIDETCSNENAFQHTPPSLICGPKNARSEVINFVEFGIHNQTTTNYPYAAIGAFAGTKAVEIEFLAGIHQKSAFF